MYYFYSLFLFLEPILETFERRWKHPGKNTVNENACLECRKHISGECDSDSVKNTLLANVILILQKSFYNDISPR